MTTHSPTAFELRGWHVLAGILAFFGAIIAVNIAFAVMAVRTFPGEDVKRAYVQGLDYNHTLAERRAQRDLGWEAAAQLERDALGPLVAIQLRDRDGAALDGASIEGALRWAADARRDRALSFVEDGPGRYVARLDGESRGRWVLRGRATRGGAALDFEAELTWPTAR